VSLLKMAPYAVPDGFAVMLFAGTVVLLLAWRMDAIRLVLGGVLFGVVRSSWSGAVRTLL
jgi:hypothetical protein